MKVLKPLPHAVLDYAWAGMMIAAPWLLGFSKNKRATVCSVTSGTSILALSLMTKYPLGVAKLIPFPVHGVIEAVAGAMVAADPWVLGFKDNGRAKWTHVVAGLGTLGVVAMTDYNAEERRRQLPARPGAGLAEQVSDQPEAEPEARPDLGPPTHFPATAGR